MTIVAEPAAGQIIKVCMAGIGYGQPENTLETLLGSCIGIAIWDRTTRMGSLAHVVLPDSRGDTKTPGKFADTAVEAMCQGLIERGAYRTSLVSKLTGGATMFGKRSDRDVGEKNHHSVLEQLKAFKIPVMAEHVGGEKGRVIRFSLDDFSIEINVGQEVVAVI